MTCATLHRLAMTAADQRDFRTALALERRAASLADREPSRGALYLSAAWLARECGDLVEARRLAVEGLEGTLPRWLREELEEVLDGP